MNLMAVESHGSFIDSFTPPNTSSGASPPPEALILAALVLIDDGEVVNVSLAGYFSKRRVPSDKSRKHMKASSSCEEMVPKLSAIWTTWLRVASSTLLMLPVQSITMLICIFATLRPQLRESRVGGEVEQ
jgi:hypothetical protein